MRRDKLLGAKKREQARNARIQAEKDAEEAAEQAAIEEQRIAEEVALKKAEQKKIQVERMKVHFKKFCQDLMWKKLKEIKAKEEEKLEQARKEASIKRQLTLQKQKELMKGFVKIQTIES